MKNTLLLALAVIFGMCLTLLVLVASRGYGFIEGQEVIQEFCDDEVIFRFTEGGKRYYCIGEGPVRPTVKPQGSMM